MSQEEVAGHEDAEGIRLACRNNARGHGVPKVPSLHVARRCGLGTRVPKGRNAYVQFLLLFKEFGYLVDI